MAKPRWPLQPALIRVIQQAVADGRVTQVRLAKLSKVSSARWSQILAEDPPRTTYNIQGLPQILYELRLATSAWLPGLTAAEKDMLAILEAIPYSKQARFLSVIRLLSQDYAHTDDGRAAADDRPPPPDGWRANTNSGGRLSFSQVPP